MKITLTNTIEITYNIRAKHKRLELQERVDLAVKKLEEALKRTLELKYADFKKIKFSTWAWRR